MTKKEFLNKLAYDITLNQSLAEISKFNGKTSGDKAAKDIAQTVSRFYNSMAKAIDEFPDMWDDEK